ncbi:D-tyrosyl-tRNA(Tyr) deacylase [Thermosyntropha lipolytica DSM 11003]|uniref:D-aminoacyl-tRNA deacylase n=1 Tax=Thermosyntropha lipolytica DSM 11003 TaxID=1123382 RepID=A0A1M5P0G8_9FIRM|nr:D-aminoacyl-tRNA deacylase [Thermosyntropha lipolytica]SHG95290.1 D-tyrosyl-tRNA(Tyr) deacylase [Thermosyntropha lipolytica DSM 11003]
MRAVVQRTNHSKVTVEGEVKGEILKGLTVLLGIKKGDSEKDAAYMMDKIANLRIFEDEDGKMNLSLLDIKGEILLVSQFTLYGDARKGRRPSFSDAEIPERAEELFNYCVKILRDMGIKVETGVFGAGMQVLIENDGPCTILLDSERIF